MKWLLTCFLIFGANSVFAQVVYNQTKNQLELPSVKVGDTIYTDVVITVGQVLTLGGSYPDPGLANFSLEAAYRQFIQVPETKAFDISGIVEGISMTGSGSVTAGRMTGTTFEGRSALSQTATFSLTLRGNGQSVPFSTSSTTYYDSNYRLLGSMGTTYEVVTSYYGFPSSATANDAGLLYQSTIYRDSSKRLIDGKRTVTYSTTFESPSTLVLTVIDIEKDNLGNTTLTSSARYRVASDNSVTRLGETANDSSSFLVMAF